MSEQNNNVEWESTFYRAEELGLTLRDIMRRAGGCGQYPVINFVKSSCTEAESRAQKMAATDVLQARERE